MNSLKRNKYDSYWMVRLPGFPKEKREALQKIAAQNRMSTSAYIGNLLDRELEKSAVEPVSHPNSSNGDIRDGYPG